MILVLESTSKLNTIKILLNIKHLFSRIFILSEPFTIPIDGDFNFIKNHINIPEYIYIKDTCKVNQKQIENLIDLEISAKTIYVANKYDDVFILFCMITGKIPTLIPEFVPDYLKAISKIDKSIMDDFNETVVECIFKVDYINNSQMYKQNNYREGLFYYTGIII